MNRVMRSQVRQNAGFTLIELMIVVAIIAIVAAIALVSLLRSRIQSNETAAIQNLRAVCAAELAFNSVRFRFADFATLTSETDGKGLAFLNGTWTDGVEKNGYRFYLPTSDEDQFVCYADPARLGRTGTRYFRVDTAGIIRVNDAARPSDTDPGIGK